MWDILNDGLVTDPRAFHQKTLQWTIHQCSQHEKTLFDGETIEYKLRPSANHGKRKVEYCKSYEKISHVYASSGLKPLPSPSR